jgi:uncharacterized protein (DUF1778 family)
MVTKQFVIRPSEDDKELFRQAMSITGDVSMANFITRQARRAAILIVEEGLQKQALRKSLEVAS